jgi:hypothetical protein
MSFFSGSLLTTSFLLPQEKIKKAVKKHKMMGLSIV